MTRWVALPGRDGAAAAGPPEALVLEFALPLDGPQVLLDARAGGLALSVFADPGAGLAVLLRRGAEVARHRIAGDLRLPARGVARLTLGWPGEGWVLALDLPGEGRLRAARGRQALRPTAGDCAALCAPGAAATEGAALLWHGVAGRGGLAAPAGWIGPATPVDTPEGPRPAALLRAGDRVMTPQGPRPLLAVRHSDLPTAGSLAPVRLRAPYLAREDVLAGPEQGIALSGIAVEYLFGEDRVAVLARQLADDRIAATDRRPGVLRAVVLDTGGQPFGAAGCLFVPPDAAGPRWLADWEAIPLRQSLDTSARGRAA